MSRFANRKLIGHHLTSSQLGSMLSLHAGEDCPSRRASNTWNSRSALNVSEMNHSVKEAPRLLRYLSATGSKSCSVCGLDVESEGELMAACSECLLKIEAALSNPGRDQAGQDQDRENARAGQKRKRVAKESEQPFSIIIVQDDKHNALVDQLMMLVNRAISKSSPCPVSPQQKQQRGQQPGQQTSQQKRQQRSPAFHYKKNLERHASGCSCPKNSNTSDPTGLNQQGLEQEQYYNAAPVGGAYPCCNCYANQDEARQPERYPGNATCGQQNQSSNGNPEPCPCFTYLIQLLAQTLQVFIDSQQANKKDSKTADPSDTTNDLAKQKSTKKPRKKKKLDPQTSNDSKDSKDAKRCTGKCNLKAKPPFCLPDPQQQALEQQQQQQQQQQRPCCIRSCCCPHRQATRNSAGGDQLQWQQKQQQQQQQQRYIEHYPPGMQLPTHCFLPHSGQVVRRNMVRTAAGVTLQGMFPPVQNQTTAAAAAASTKKPTVLAGKRRRPSSAGS